MTETLTIFPLLLFLFCCVVVVCVFSSIVPVLSHFYFARMWMVFISFCRVDKATQYSFQSVAFLFFRFFLYHFYFCCCCCFVFFLFTDHFSSSVSYMVCEWNMNRFQRWKCVARVKTNTKNFPTSLMPLVKRHKPETRLPLLSFQRVIVLRTIKTFPCNKIGWHCNFPYGFECGHFFSSL